MPQPPSHPQRRKRGGPLSPRYDTAFRASALVRVALNSGNVFRTARHLGIPNQTLVEWVRNRKGITPEVEEAAAVLKKRLAEELRELARYCVQILPDKLDRASAAQVAMVMGIAIDKSQILDGEPSGIIAHEERQDGRTLYQHVQHLLGQASRVTITEDPVPVVTEEPVPLRGIGPGTE